MDIKKETVKVSIFGTEYQVKANEDYEYIKSVAKYVDNIMLELEKDMDPKSPLKVAVLAALNIADELMRERKEKERLLELTNKEVGKLVEKIGRGIRDSEK
jgi:cell division protein ZapA